MNTVPSPDRRKGLTLVEVIVAVVILFLGSVFIFKMFHYAIHTSGTMGDEVIASLIAQKRIEEVRGWACQRPATSYNFNAGNWEIFNNTTFPDPDYPMFSVTTHIAPYDICSPSSSIEPHKVLGSSYRCIKVEVTWQAGTGSRKITLASLIGEPRRKLSAVSISMTSPSPVRVGPNESVSFSSQGTDEQGQRIDDLTFRWYSAPITASGTMAYTGFGNSSLFYNYIRRGTTTINSTGTCKVLVKARCGGMSSTDYSVQMELYQ